VPHRANARANDILAAEFNHWQRQHLRADEMQNRAQAAAAIEEILLMEFVL